VTGRDAGSLSRLARPSVAPPPRTVMRTRPEGPPEGGGRDISIAARDRHTARAAQYPVRDLPARDPDGQLIRGEIGVVDSTRGVAPECRRSLY
jgi:hypothetical protein